MARRVPRYNCRHLDDGQQCGHRTRSVTRLCHEHRSPDDVPIVHIDRTVANIAGLTLTATQARRVADQLHDAADTIEKEYSS